MTVTAIENFTLWVTGLLVVCGFPFSPFRSV